MKEQITIRFFYANGKSIGFVFVWSGQEINYGVDMGVSVKLRSELDGVVNAGLRSYAQAYDKPASAQASISKLEKQFGVESYGLVKYTTQSDMDLKKAKVENAYASDIVFSSALSNRSRFFQSLIPHPSGSLSAHRALTPRSSSSKPL